MIDVVADTVRQTWNEVSSFNVIEFLNILCYRIDKGNWERAQIDKKHKIRRL